ncbi:MAG: radical SAM protein [Gemmatimonadetes bacterium]|nr:radical SAM protein [Gemmatimonadota bacterium]
MSVSRAAVRAERPAKPAHDPRLPLGQRWDVERAVRPAGAGASIGGERVTDPPQRRALTVFLAGAECPFACLFCDLWQHTLEGSTPEGALPRQLETAIGRAGGIEPDAAIKLYNASNFFDRRAVPAADVPTIAELCGPFERVTVETHPKLVGAACDEFQSLLRGRLEIAMGLETVHPDVFPRLKDGMTVADFDGATRRARARGVGVRAFVLVGLPWVTREEFASWAVRSVIHAIESGADRASLIPLRAENGALARLRQEGELADVRLYDLEVALSDAIRAIGGSGIVEADLWDAASFSACDACGDRRLANLAAMNRTGRATPPTECGCEAT